MATRRKYRVQLERDESGWWIVSVPAVPGCHTQGRTLAEARRRIREALGLFVDDASRADLVEDVKMPKFVKSAVRDYREARKKAEEAQRTARVRARRVVQVLGGGKLNLSRRDTAEVLGVSPQRVQQLVKS
jgi:predicted RNase H-like HicB family nuclease